MSISKSVRSLLLVLLVVLMGRGIQAASPAVLPGLRVSSNGHFLEKTDGTPFFWLGDTAWRLNSIPPGDVDFYLSNRVQNQFTGIQTDLGFNVSDYAGNRPYLNDNTDTPNGAYWSNLDSIVTKAGNNGLYIALVVMWGNQYNLAFGNDTNKAYRLGNWLGNRYGSRSHVLWIVAGEYDSIGNWTNPIDPAKKALLTSVAQGLRDAHQGSQLMTIHPASPITSSVEFHTAGWLSFNMLQSGHQNDSEAWGLPENRTVISSDYNKSPTKPVLDGEPAYEDTPDGIWIGAGTGGQRMGADVIRRKAWGAVFAGACGHTYGHNDVHSFWVPGMPSEIAQGGTGQRASWKTSVNAAGASQMRHLRTLIESRSFLNRIPDQSMIVSGAGSGTNFIQATRASNGSYAFVYLPTGNTVRVDMSKISGGGAACGWYDPRTGGFSPIGTFANSGTRDFDAPGGTAAGNDWVLVLDSSGGPVGGPPAVPTILSPANNATVNTTAVTVSWAAAAGAASYLIRCEDLTGTTPPDPRNTWSGLFVGIDQWAPTSITFTTVNGHSYHLWLHSAAANFSYNDPNSYSALTEIWFTVNTGGGVGGPPAVPTILSPANNATVNTTAVTVSWAAAAGAASYLIRCEDLTGTTPPDPRNTWSGLFVGIDQWAPTSITFTTVNGHSYHFWVHSATASFSYGDPNSYSPAAEIWFTVNGGGTVGNLTGTYTLLNVNSGLALDVFGLSLMDGGAVVQWTPNGGANQQWQVTGAGNGAYFLLSVNSGMALDVYGASQSSGGPVVQWTLHGGANQQWQILPAGDGTCYLLNVNSGQALNVSGASTADGGEIIQWPYGGEASSRWMLQSVSGGAAQTRVLSSSSGSSKKSGGACGLLGLEVLLALALGRRLRRQI